MNDEVRRMTKKEHINFWIDQANDDWEVAEALFKISKFAQALFWGHLVAEKFAKAIWVKASNENLPPRTHNILFLLSKTDIKIPESISELIVIINKFQIEGRYPEYITRIEHELNEEKTAMDNFDKLKTLIQWLKEHLQ